MIKKRIGLTMRMDIASTGEARDALDCLWPELMKEIGFFPVYLPSGMSVFGNEAFNDIDAFILTGGNDIIEGQESFYGDRNTFENSILSHADKHKLPVLGVCRGAQMINLYCGGQSSSLNGHVAQDHEVFWNQQKIKVNSYHNYGIRQDELADNLEIQAFAQDSTIEAFRHKYLPWFGMMWHPERPIDNPQMHKEIVRKALLGEEI